MSDYRKQRAKEIMSKIKYATIATASNSGKPWNSPVAYFTDSVPNIYWFSDKSSVHSGNIRENEDVFAVIYDSTMKEGTGEGLFIEGVAYEVSDAGEVSKISGYQTGSMRVKPEQCMEDAIHRFYKFIPTRAWMNDEEKDEQGNYVKDIRVEIPLKALSES